MKQIINVPFPGFCFSWYGQEIDWEMENAVEGYIESDPRDIPKELKDEVLGIFQRNFNLAVCHNRICKDYVKAFNEWFEEKYELDLELEFESMTSPKYYNFETDRVFAFIHEEKVQALCDLARPKLDAEIKRRFTSRDGFISHYPNSLVDWPKYLSQWDHNELGTLLTALFSREEDHDWEVYEKLCDSECFACAVDASIDWPGFNADVHEFLMEKAREEWEKETDVDVGRVFPTNITDPAAYVKKFIQLNNLRS